MKTKLQKQTELDKASKLLGESASLVFVDFSGINTSSLRELRKTMSSLGGTVSVVKKRLLKVLFKEKGIDLDTTKLEGPVASVFAKGTIEEVSAPIYKFFAGLAETETKKKADNVKRILGGLDCSSKAEVEAATILMIGQLPPREALLGQLFSVIAGPLRAFMYVLKQKSEKVG